MQTARWGLGVAVVDDMLYAIGGSPFLYQPDVAENAQYKPFGYGTVPPDTTSPTVSIISPENKTYRESAGDPVADVPLTYTVSEPASWIGYSLNGQANVTITENTTLTGLSYGSHSLTVYAKDTAGNIGTSEIIYFTIEIMTVDPQLPEPFPTTWIIAASIVIIAIAAVAGYLFLKRKK